MLPGSLFLCGTNLHDYYYRIFNIAITLFCTLNPLAPATCIPPAFLTCRLLDSEVQGQWLTFLGDIVSLLLAPGIDFRQVLSFHPPREVDVHPEHISQLRNSQSVRVKWCAKVTQPESEETRWWRGHTRGLPAGSLQRWLSLALVLAG